MWYGLYSVSAIIAQQKHEYRSDNISFEIKLSPHFRQIWFVAILAT